MYIHFKAPTSSAFGFGSTNSTLSLGAPTSFTGLSQPTSASSISAPFGGLGGQPTSFQVRDKNISDKISISILVLFSLEDLYLLLRQQQPHLPLD